MIRQPGYRQFHILAPVATHWRPATCAEVECAKHVNGFELTFDESDDRPGGGREAAAYFRSKYRGLAGFTEWRRPDQATVFRLPPGLKPPGFEHDEHRIRIERPEAFVESDTTTGRILRVHDGAEDGAVNWVEDFATNQELVVRQLDRAKEMVSD